MHHRYKGYIFVYTRSYTYYVGGMIHEKMYKVVFLKKLFRTSRTICTVWLVSRGVPTLYLSQYGIWNMEIYRWNTVIGNR